MNSAERTVRRRKGRTINNSFLLAISYNTQRLSTSEVRPIQFVREKRFRGSKTGRRGKIDRFFALAGFKSLLFPTVDEG